MKGSRNWHPKEIVPGLVTGYDQEADGYRTAEPFSMTQSFAAGSLLSTVDDMALWADALSSGKLLKGGAEPLIALSRYFRILQGIDRFYSAMSR